MIAVFSLGCKTRCGTLDLDPHPGRRAWTDPTSLEAFGRAVDRIMSLRVLLIVTFRPEFEPPWIGQPHVSALTINRLTRREIDTMIDRVVGNKLLPASIREDIIERSDGIHSSGGFGARLPSAATA